MRSIKLDLPKKMADHVETQVVAGRYRNASAYLKSLIKADEEQMTMEQLKALLREGLESGAGVPLTEARLEHLRQQGLKLASRLRKVRDR